MLKITVKPAVDYNGTPYVGVVKYHVSFQHPSNWRLNKTIAHSPFGVESAAIAMADIKKKLFNRLDVIQRNFARLQEELAAFDMESNEIVEWLETAKEG